jgi:phage/plasmid-associated DNA primase
MTTESNTNSFYEVSKKMTNNSDYYFQLNNNKNMVDLFSYLHNSRNSFKTKKGDSKTNIINPRSGCYIIPDNSIGEFFEKYDKCRQDNCILNFAEKQTSETNPISGIMLDFDCLVTVSDFNLDNYVYQQLYSIIVYKYLAKQLVIPNDYIDVCLFVITRPVTTKKDTCYKSGFHILLPGVQVSRAYKKFLIESLRKDDSFNKVLNTLNIINTDPDNHALDINSSHVPVFFYGSSKQEGYVYKLTHSFKIEGNLNNDGMFMVVNKIDNNKEYNMAWELSLNYEAKYINKITGEKIKNPLVKKSIYQVRPELEALVKEYGDVHKGEQTPRDHINEVQAEVDDLINQDSKAKILNGILDLIADESPDYYTDYNKWRDIIFAVANTSKNYYPLVAKFSLRSSEKYDESALKSLWNDAVQSRYENNIKNPLTLATLKYWARKANPERYRQVIDSDAKEKLTNYVYKYGGSIEHSQVANILAILFGHKFVVDESANGRGYIWHEFIMPGDRSEYGENWKWRERQKPLDLYEFISEEFELICDQVKDELRKRIDNNDNEEATKRLVKILNKFIVSSKSIFQHGFKTGVIKECEAKLYKHGFCKRLNKNGNLLGVANGIVILGKKCKIINHFHEHLISKFTPVNARYFNPNEPMTKMALKIIKDIIPERDARVKLMMFWASCLDGWPKDPEMLIGTGTGSNAKTTLLKIIKYVFGPEYGQELPANLMMQEAPSADKPNSAIASIEDKRAAFMEETDKKNVMNPSMVKKLVNPGDISNRDLNSKQKQFKITSKITLMTNHKPRIDIKDPALKRRLFHYAFKCYFCANPRPDTYDRKGDPRIVKEFPDNPEFQSAVLSILMHFYEVLQICYNGDLKKVKSPTIDRETEEFFNEYDDFAQFVKDRIVYSPESENTYLLNNVASEFKTWLSETEQINKRDLSTNSDIIKEIKDSVSLGKHVRNLTNGNSVLTNCRILSKDDITLRPGEQYISFSKTLEFQGVQSVLSEPDNLDWWNPEDYKKIMKDLNEQESESKKNLGNNDDFVADKIEKDYQKKVIDSSVDSLLNDL